MAPEKSKYSTPNENQLTPVIEVAGDRRVTHPVVLRIKESILVSSKDKRGLLQPKTGRIVPVGVSAGALPRALRILDALFSSLGERGYSLEWPSPYNTTPQIVADGEKMWLLLTEKIGQKALPKIVPYRYRECDWEYTQTGQLRLKLGSSDFSNIRQEWFEGNHGNLESFLGEFLIACENIVLAVKRAREEKTERDRLHAEWQERQAAAAVVKAEYDRKAGELKELLEAWQQSNLIRDFVSALQAKMATAEMADDIRKRLDQIVEWSCQHADRLDPLKDLDRTIRQFTIPFWRFARRNRL